MRKNEFVRNNYRSGSRNRISAEDEAKQQAFMDGLKNDAAFYCLDHIESSMIPHSMLHKIIQKLKTKQKNVLTLQEKNYLLRQNLNSLYNFNEGKISFNQYKKEAANDKAHYEEIQALERLRLEKIKELEKIEYEKQQAKLNHERKLREKAEMERRKKLESDPKYIEQQKEKQLIKKYEIDLFDVAKKNKVKIIEIIKLLDTDQRLPKEDSVWLNSVGRRFFTDSLKVKFHRVEAAFYLNEYKIKKSHWDAINASSQLRKAKASKEAETFLEKTEIKLDKNKRLLAAYFTTLGGVKRDLGKRDVAIECGEKAHETNKQDYRPCTLLGAIYMEQHNYTLGHDWYEKARDRGAPENSINSELKSILMKLDKAQRNEMISSLVNRDAYQYSWLKKLIK